MQGPLTTLEMVTLVALWCAGTYRLVITVRQPWALWRASFTAAMLLIPLGTTAHFFRAHVGTALDTPNIGGLIAHICLTAGATCVAIYVDTLKQEHPRPGRAAQHVAIGGVTILIIITTWMIAPLHAREVAGLSPYSTHPAVATYSLTFYSYLAIILLVVIDFCARETKAAARTALTKITSLALIGLGCVVGLPILATFAAMAAATALAGREPQFLQDLVQVAAAAAPWSLGLLAAGVLSLVILPTLIGYYAAQRRWHRLRPLWADLVHRHPDVRLTASAQPMVGRQAFEIREQRAVIEIYDALQRTLVPAAPGQGVEALAHSLADTRPLPGQASGAGCAASEVLVPAHDHQGDLDQLLALAHAWTRMRDNGEFRRQRINSTLRRE